jgi:murein DD-endopeptidase MepM/ murein hydrolase activator NlpD
MHDFRFLLFIVSLTFFLPTPAPALALALREPTQLPTEQLQRSPSTNEKIYYTRDCITATVSTTDPLTGAPISRTEVTCFTTFYFDEGIWQVPWRVPGGEIGYAYHLCSRFDLDMDGLIDCFKDVVVGEPSSAYPLGESRDWGPRPDGNGGSDFHDAVDISAPEGSMVRSAQEGRVGEVGNDARNGNYIRVNHADGSQTVYIHLRDAPIVRVGQLVMAGTRIGVSGQTGAARGPHLHFTIWGGQDAASRCEGCSYDPEAAFNWDC